MRSIAFAVCLVATVACAGVSAGQDTSATHETHGPAPAHIRPGDKLYIQPSDFGLALSAAILKKNVPVTVTTDSAKADFFVVTTSQSTHEGSGERVAKVLMFGSFAGSGKHFDGTATFTNRDGDVVFAYNSRKENFQAAAQNVANNLKKRIEEWHGQELADAEKH